MKLVEISDSEGEGRVKVKSKKPKAEYNIRFRLFASGLWPYTLNFEL